MTTSVAVFLSSTFTDLEEHRAAVLRHLEVLRSEVISMEFFGSDEARPLDHALAEIDRCNLFVGIYAHRYGSLDPETGRSITEIEYRHALHRQRAGQIMGLLLYVIADEAPWPFLHIEPGVGQDSLRAFKAELRSRHTVTMFHDAAELPLLILGDAIRKIGIGRTEVFRARPQTRPTRASTLDRPVGMEYYTSDLAPYFLGRERETQQCLAQVTTHPMSLLIGPSGIGKTSLVWAGIRPALLALGWGVALTRPLTAGATAITAGVWSQFLEGALHPGMDRERR